jgi:uncharacterized membrane protein
MLMLLQAVFFGVAFCSVRWLQGIAFLFLLLKINVIKTKKQCAASAQLQKP